MSRGLLKAKEGSCDIENTKINVLLYCLKYLVHQMLRFLLLVKKSCVGLLRKLKNCQCQHRKYKNHTVYHFIWISFVFPFLSFGALIVVLVAYPP